MSIDFAKISTLVFDLGGVIVDLDVEQTVRELSFLSGFEETSMRAHLNTHAAFLNLEKGVITEGELLIVIR